MHGLSQREIHRRTGLRRDTINSREPSKYQRAPAGSKLDPFKDEIHRLLKGDRRMPGRWIRELLGPPGFDGGTVELADHRCAGTFSLAFTATSAGQVPLR